MLWFLVLAIRHHDASGGNTFRDFYQAAAALRHRESLSNIKGYIYPPLMAWLLQPLTFLAPALAYRVWQGTTFLLTSSSLWMGYRVIARRFAFPTDWKSAITVILGALILSAGEAKTEWSVAQSDSLVLDSFVFSLLLLETFPVAAGAVIAFGVNIKYQAIVLLPYLLWRRRFKAAASATFFIGVLGALPGFSMGWMPWRESWGAALGGMGKLLGLPGQHGAQIHALTWDHSVSVTSALARISAAFGGSANLAFPLAVTLAIGSLVWCALIYRRQHLPIIGGKSAARFPQLLAIEWSTLIVLLLAFGPQTTRRHLFLLLFFHLIIAAHLILPKLDSRSRRWLWIGVTIYQLGLRLPPSATWCASASEAWKFVGGPAICLLGVWLLLLKILAPTFRPTSPSARLEWKKSAGVSV